MASGRSHDLGVDDGAHLPGDDQRKIAGIEGIARDITEQRNAADAVRTSRNQLRLIADSVPALILYVDRDLKIRFANREAAEWFARDIDELVDADIAAVSNDVWVEWLQSHWEAALKGEM